MLTAEPADFMMDYSYGSFQTEQTPHFRLFFVLHGLSQGQLVRVLSAYQLAYPELFTLSW